MTAFLRNPVTTWVVLVVVTVGNILAISTISPRIAGVGVLVIAAVKARLVTIGFMELNHAPRPLGLAFDLWILVTVLALCVVLLIT